MDVCIRLTRQISEEFTIPGMHLCGYTTGGNSMFLIEMTCILGTVWAIIVLCFAVWIAIKRFRELQRASTGWAIWDCFEILLKTHVLYFAR